MTALEKYYPLAGTLVFHALLFLLLLLGMRSCNVSTAVKEEVHYESLSLAALGDFEPGEGEYVDLGSEAEAVEAAHGDIEQVISDMQSQVETQGSSTPTPEENNPSPNPSNEPSAEQLEQEAKKNKINKLFSGGSNSSAGNTPGGTGIEGNPNGELGGKGQFGGKGGSVQWNLKGRGVAKEPSLEQKPQYEGTIFVNITVDSKGNVTAATVDPQKSKVAGEGFQQLSELAKKAAFATKFSVVDDAKKQVGSIVITFKLK